MTQPSDNLPDGELPEQQEPDAPRRGASAQFAVSQATGAQAAMRQAMDPANQSLAEALRLSYRVLQGAIVALVVVFLFSGFQTVKEGQTGVKTFFGRIVGEPGMEQVVPGLQPFWPYPAGEIVLLPQKDAVDLGSEFWPSLKSNVPGKVLTLDEATSGASPTDPIRPGESGSLITADGDLVHARVTAEFVVEDSVRTLGELQPEKLRDIVRRALARGLVQTAAQYTLQEFLESRDQPPQVLRQRAQQALDAMKSGITLSSVVITDKVAPLAVRNSYSRVQEARVNATTSVNAAQGEAKTTLISMAGPEYPRLLEVIERYEAELTRGDLAAADRVLAELGERLEGRASAGETSAIIGRAQSYQETVRATLGKEARRLEGLVASYRENPVQLVRKLWLDALRDVIASGTAEVFSTPADGGPVRLAIESSPEVMQTRRRDELERRKRANDMNMGIPGFNLGSRQIIIDGPGRRLERSGDKGFGRD
ncbi:MAG: SPFH domain-containing protein [Phycisphaerales bacterium]